MYLYNLKLWNFRKYGSEGEIDLGKPDLNVFSNNGLNLLTGEMILEKLLLLMQ